MAKFILGKKLHMTQIFAEDGRVVPVTVVEAGPCTVTQVKGEKDGYSAVQVGFGNKKRTNKPLAGHLKGFDNFRYLKEFRVENTQAFAKGKVFDVSTFAVGDKLKVTATSKGKGFQGVVKRHGFHGSPASHGHKDQLRMPGSIGATDAARVFKGLRMAGRMGGDNVTVDNLELIKIDAEKNLLYVKGAVPGARNSFVILVTGGEINFVEAKKDVPVEAETKVEEVKTEVEAKEETPVEVKEETEETKVEDKESNIPSEVKGEEVKEDKK